jgi:hypothetical protein
MFRCGTAALLFVLLAVAVVAQEPNEAPVVNAPSKSVTSPFINYQNNWGLLPPGADPQNRLGTPFLKHLVEDQKTFWTSPFRLQKENTKSSVPFFAFTGILFASDSWISDQVPDSPSQLKRSQNFSNYALLSLAGTAAGGYLWGRMTHNDHLQEAGLLSSEAAINSLFVTTALGYATQRPRPIDSNGNSSFFQGGSSFPSDHSAIAWSIASVVAHEYPGPLTKLLAYGLASGITVSRVTSKQHYASDAFIGSALGWYLGRQIYRARHDPGLGGTAWGSDAPESAGGEHPRKSPASSDVPLDSWVYPAIERLAAWGYIQTQFLGQRPWTRLQCAELLEEASGRIPLEDSGEVGKVYSALEEEFAPEMQGPAKPSLRLESIYTRVTNVSGQPINDSYNFASTIVNNDGRPYQQGTNVYSGASGYANAGPFAFYVRAEYQHAPSAPAFPLDVRQAVAKQLALPVAPNTPFAEINRLRILEGYVSVAIQGLQFSFGKQALWWGPTQAGPLMWSTNAEPISMFRITSIAPFKFPSILRWLGPAQTEFFIGQLDGHQYISNQSGLLNSGHLNTQPFIHGQKISFKPTPNLELGFARTVTFGGDGHPFTTHSFLKSFFSVGTDYGGAHGDAGDRHSGFDLSYKVPHLRKWLTVYTDSFCEDDPLSLSAPRRCAWNPGFFVSQFPRIPKLDLRVEGITTDVAGFPAPTPVTGINYTNVVYRSGYTNDGNILGSWVGRQGRGVQLWSNYWLSAQSKIQFGYRHQTVNDKFLEGGSLNDFSLSADIMLRPDLNFSGSIQHENWNFPLFGTDTRSNWATSISLTFRPKWGLKGR